MLKASGRIAFRTKRVAVFHVRLLSADYGRARRHLNVVVVGGNGSLVIPGAPPIRFTLSPGADIPIAPGTTFRVEGGGRPLSLLLLEWRGAAPSGEEVRRWLNVVARSKRAPRGLSKLRKWFGFPAEPDTLPWSATHHYVKTGKRNPRGEALYRLEPRSKRPPGGNRALVRVTPRNTTPAPGEDEIWWHNIGRERQAFVVTTKYYPRAHTLAERRLALRADIGKKATSIHDQATTGLGEFLDSFSQHEHALYDSADTWESVVLDLTQYIGVTTGKPAREVWEWLGAKFRAGKLTDLTALAVEPSDGRPQIVSHLNRMIIGDRWSKAALNALMKEYAAADVAAVLGWQKAASESAETLLTAFARSRSPWVRAVGFNLVIGVHPERLDGLLRQQNPDFARFAPKLRELAEDQNNGDQLFNLVTALAKA